MSTFKSVVLFAAIFILTFYPAYSSPTPALHFQTEQAAQMHCPNDSVVWVNTKTGTYHLKGEWWYGATKQGT
jgi:hypothetical protein